MIVVDANVIMALIRETTRTPEAQATYAMDSDWTVPSLWQYEVLNALINEVKAGHLTLPLAIVVAQNATRLFCDCIRNSRPDDILTIARTAGLTAYDASYVALARSLGTVLVTEDKQVLRTCPDVARSMIQFLAPPGPIVKEKHGVYTAKPRNKAPKRTKEEKEFHGVGKQR
jgi:predicted nucleic acid-binding protein